MMSMLLQFNSIIMLQATEFLLQLGPKAASGSAALVICAVLLLQDIDYCSFAGDSPLQLDVKAAADSV